jgi:uncharacterized membrane protein
LKLPEQYGKALIFQRAKLLRKTLFKVHKENCEVIAQKRLEEATRLIEKDIQDVRERSRECKRGE